MRTIKLNVPFKRALDFNGKTLEVELVISAEPDTGFDSYGLNDDLVEQINEGHWDPMIVEVKASFGGLTHSEFLGGVLVNGPDSIFDSVTYYNMEREALDGLRKAVDEFVSLVK